MNKVKVNVRLFLAAIAVSVFAGCTTVIAPITVDKEGMEVENPPEIAEWADYRKGSPSPEDFDRFWSEARKRLADEVPLDAHVTPVPERTTPAFDFFRIDFATFGRRIYGYMSVPKDVSKAPFPVEIQVSAAGMGGWSNNMPGQTDCIKLFFSVYDWEPDWRWEEKNLQERYKAMNDEYRRRYSCKGYPTAGITESREAYFFYPVLLGIDRAVDWVCARKDVDLSRVWYEGTSQGGGFGFYLCALNRNFTRATFFVPAITDTMGYLAGRESGWPKIVEGNSSTPELKAAAEKNAPYFDAANFAERITIPVRVAAGLSDNTCPPSAVTVAFNHLASKDKAIIYGKDMTHSCYGKIYERLGKWRRQ